MFNSAFAGVLSALPIQGSDIAVPWDHLYHFVFGLSVFFFVLVIGAMLYFIVAYKHDPRRKTQYITHHHLLEAIWIGIPAALLMVLFVWGYFVYIRMVTPPTEAYEIRVTGKQWFWTFQYDDGSTTVNDVFIPVDKPVKFILTSEDVLHGFFIPNFRIKTDVVPGMYTSLWFTATVPGRHQVFCTEYCGTSHSQMLANIVALDDNQWEEWQSKRLKEPILKASDTDVPEEKLSHVQVSLIEQGKKVYRNKGCMGCHSVDGSAKIGPSHKGLFGRKEVLADGREIIVDDNFVRAHIDNPLKNTLKGYSPIMPTFKGLISEQEMTSLMVYLKSLK